MLDLLILEKPIELSNFPEAYIEQCIIGFVTAGIVNGYSGVLRFTIEGAIVELDGQDALDIIKLMQEHPDKSYKEATTIQSILKEYPNITYKEATYIYLERELNRITSGKFSERLDQWQANVAKENISNEYWNQRKSIIIDILESEGLDKGAANKFISDNGINADALADSIANQTGRAKADVLSEINDYLSKHPVVVDEELITLKSIESCITAEETLLKRYQNGDIKNIDKALEMLAADKNALRALTGITGSMTVGEVKDTDYYKTYVNEVMSEERQAEVMGEMIPDGKEGKVYCIQDKDSFEGFTLGKGTLGRNEGYYAISEQRLADALSAATGRQISPGDDVAKFMNGEMSGIEVDLGKLENDLSLPPGTFSKGAYVVEAPATPDSLRFSLPTDDGANAQYIPGFQTGSDSNEVINAQVNGINFNNKSTGVYEDSSLGIKAKML